MCYSWHNGCPACENSAFVTKKKLTSGVFLFPLLISSAHHDMMIYTKSQKAEIKLDGDLYTMVSPIFIFVITTLLQIPRTPQTHSPVDNVFSSNVTIFLLFKTSTSPFRTWLFWWFPEICMCQFRPVESNIFCGHLLPRAAHRAWHWMSTYNPW